MKGRETKECRESKWWPASKLRKKGASSLRTQRSRWQCREDERMGRDNAKSRKSKLQKRWEIARADCGTKGKDERWVNSRLHRLVRSRTVIAGSENATTRAGSPGIYCPGAACNWSRHRETVPGCAHAPVQARDGEGTRKAFLINNCAVAQQLELNAIFNSMLSCQLGE